MADRPGAGTRGSPEMAERLLYRNLARYYDLIYSFKDYQTEARRIIEVVEASKKSDGHDL